MPNLTPANVDQEGERPSMEVEIIAALFDRHGIAPRQRHGALEAILGVSYQQARRRLGGVVPWTLSELRRVAAHFGESLPSLLANVSGNPGVVAHLLAGNLRIPCLLWPGSELKTGRSGPLVALHTVNGEWLAVPATEAGPSPAFEVLRLIVQPPSRSPRRVAVLDDDVVHADSIAKYLCEMGLDAEAFFSFATLAESIAEKPFDGYVLDWLIGNENAKNTIAAIRAQDLSCPVIVLTGQIDRGNVSEAEIAATASTYRVQSLDKPARASSVLSMLEAAFEPFPAS